MKKYELVGIAEILSQLKKDTKLGENLEQAVIWERWPDIVGPKLMLHGRPQTVKEGQLRIEVDSAVWMHKYTYRKWEIIKRINTLARKKLVSEVFLVLVCEEEVEE